MTADTSSIPRWESPGFKHGRKRGYNDGCRCDECKSAKRIHDARTKARRRERAKADPSAIAHGSPAAYSKDGCRCAECVDANRQYMAAYRSANREQFRNYVRKWRTNNPEQERQFFREQRSSQIREWKRTGDPTLIPHSRTGYSYGCRCEVCRAAKRAYVRDWRATATEIPHGTPNGYSNYGCRCAACRAAGQTRRDRWREARQDESLQFAVKDGEMWTGTELEILIVREEMTVSELAELMGRTYHAVVDAKYRATHDPKWIRVVGTDEVVMTDTA